MNNNKVGIYRRFIKRPLDFILALVALIILSPFLLIVSLLVRINLGSPVIFRQKRPGLNEKIFTMYKFRTMTDEKDENGNLLHNSLRLKKFGRSLRSTSLDELPELINIIKGDMSFIGPRPLAKEYLPFYNEEEKKRHLVRPGLSGLAQIHGRNIAKWEDRFYYDNEYVKNITFLGDIKIIIKTFIIVVKRTDIGVPGVDTQLDFDVYRMEQEKI